MQNSFCSRVWHRMRVCPHACRQFGRFMCSCVFCLPCCDCALNMCYKYDCHNCCCCCDKSHKHDIEIEIQSKAESVDENNEVDSDTTTSDHEETQNEDKILKSIDFQVPYQAVGWLVYGVKCHIQQYFSYMVAVSFIDGGN